MLRKIVCLVSMPIMAMPFLYLEAAPALAASSYNQRQISSEFFATGTSSNSLLLSDRYDRDRDYDRECSRKYQEAYRDIDRDRRNLYNDDNDRDRWRHRRDLERDVRKLQDLRARYPNCDYRHNDRNYPNRDYDRNDRRDYPPVIIPPERPLR
ncbi:MAG: hypothetical protein DSM106950_32730 [Stigonema ocellatum SAG 48.90 = DSM 106950]|nr:hypothetical protein [Stigonema ocellatum SAG 48.90 = DSM 106950]